MPSRAIRTCATPGCPNIVRRKGESYCCICLQFKNARQDQNRPTSGKRGYNAEWQKLRARYLAAHPFCRECGGLAIAVHHKIKIADGGTNEESNLEALCKTCHSRLHAKSGDSFGEGR